MKSCVRRCDDATAARLQIALTALCSIAAALSSHFIIDLLGDFLLARDSYDALAHNSREAGAVALGICLIMTLLLTMRAALIEACGNEGALLALLRRATPRSPWRHWAGITISSLVLVAAMEACDAFLAGRPCDDAIDLFGGSLWLATAVAATVGALVSVSAKALLRRLTEIHRVLIALVVAIVAIAFARRAPSTFVRSFARRTYAPAAVLGSSAGGRAPPHFLSLVSF